MPPDGDVVHVDLSAEGVFGSGARLPCDRQDISGLQVLKAAATGKQPCPLPRPHSTIRTPRLHGSACQSAEK